MKSIVTLLIALILTITIIAEEPKGSPTATSAFMKNAQKGGLKLSGAGNLHAGQHGLLLVAENGGSIVAIDTGDTGTFKAISSRGASGASDYVLYTFQLIDPDTSDIVWEDFHEIKKQGKDDVTYR